MTMKRREYYIFFSPYFFFFPLFSWIRWYVWIELVKVWSFSVPSVTSKPRIRFCSFLVFPCFILPLPVVGLCRVSQMCTRSLYYTKFLFFQKGDSSRIAKLVHTPCERNWNWGKSRVTYQSRVQFYPTSL